MKAPNGKCYAAISISQEPGYVLIPARKHVYHRTYGAAVSSLESRAARMGGEHRGFIWSTTTPDAMINRNWDKLHTIAL